MLKIIKPVTATYQCSYASLLKRAFENTTFVEGELTYPADVAMVTENTLSRGRPYYFISHTWSRPFLELVGQVKQHFSRQMQMGENVFILLDIFAMNQHCHDDISSEELLKTLREIVACSEGSNMENLKPSFLIDLIACQLLFMRFCVLIVTMRVYIFFLLKL